MLCCFLSFSTMAVRRTLTPFTVVRIHQGQPICTCSIKAMHDVANVNKRERYPSGAPMIVNIPRPETLEEAKSIIDYVETHKTIIKTSPFYDVMKDAYERGDVIFGSGFKFEFRFDDETEAEKFKQKFMLHVT